MKILRVIRSLNPDAGGLTEGIHRITPHLDKLGVKTTVASLDPPDSPWLRNEGFEVLGMGPVAGSYGYKRGLPVEIMGLAKVHDVVIVEGIWQYHAFATWRALHNSKIPYFVYTHGMLDPWFKHSYPIKHLKKCMYWPWADYRVIRDAKAVLFTTEKERILARKSFKLYKANEKVVGYGTSVQMSNKEQLKENFLKHFPNIKNKRIFLFVGRIHPKKGIDILIEAFAATNPRSQGLHLVIAGPDQVGLKPILEKRIKALGISDCITWTGMLKNDLKWGAYHSAELFCLPSHQENFGIVVAESLACGVPVAIAETVNISDDIVNSRAGIVHKDTVKSTTKALNKWLNATDDSKKAMAERGYNLYLRKYNFESVAKQLVPVLYNNKS